MKGFAARLFFVVITLITTVFWIATPTHARRITFGEIMAGYKPGEVAAVSSERAAQIAALLDRLGISGKESREAYEKRLSEYNKNKLPTSQNTSTTLSASPQPTTDLFDTIATPFPSPNPTTTYLLAQLNEKSKIQLPVSNDQSTSNNATYTTNKQAVNAEHVGNLNQNPIKTTYTIAVLGDSMVDTLGPGIPALYDKLKAAFPKYSFALLNFGQGSRDLEHGLYRLTNATTYLEKYVAPVLSYSPDILVVESFAYNHWTSNQYDLDRQWLTLAYIVDTVRAGSPGTKIIIGASVGPNPYTYGDGKLNWPRDLKWESAQTTKIYLQNALNFADSQKIPAADAYHPSLDENGHGRQIYINQADHLHPSEAGKELFAQKIIETIVNNHLIN